jgi:uncharacterized membrane protein
MAKVWLDASYGADTRGAFILLRPLHPLHAVLLAGALTLAVGALLADITYARSFETQWKNFATWLVVVAEVLSAVVAVWALADFARLDRDRGPRRITYLVAASFAALLGLLNALVHTGDGWQSMPAALYLSGLVVMLLIVSTWLGFGNFRVRGAV